MARLYEYEAVRSIDNELSYMQCSAIKDMWEKMERKEKLDKKGTTYIALLVSFAWASEYLG